MLFNLIVGEKIMGIREGSVNNIPKDQLQSEAIKVFLQIDLIFFVILGLFVFLYTQMTPFSRNWVGVGGFVFIVAINLFCLAFLTSFAKKREWQLLSRYNFLNMNSILSKASEGNNILLIVSFVLVWVFALFFTPQNVYTAEFRKNATSWLDQGKCEEIKKYDEYVFSFCSELISQVRKNVSGEFMVISKNLTANATGCVYGLQSSNKEVSVFTVKPQACDIVSGQKVFISLHFFEVSHDSVDGDKFNYFLQISPIK